MTIKSKLAFRYSIITTALMTIFAAVIYIVSAHDREAEFYEDLCKEGISKASLFFEAKASPETMHSIYKNNIEYINEVEVAIYNPSFELLYHDAKDIDIVKETPELIQKILESKQNIKFLVDKYQAVGFVFKYKGANYIITATAYDGYGYNKLHKLLINLIILTIVSAIVSFILGYYMAKDALKPVSVISNRMKEITASNLSLRLLNYNENDEFGELASSFNKVLDIIESSFDAQKMFVSNVSHELRTPLAVLVGEIDYALLKERSVVEYRNTLENCKHDTKRLIKLVNGLLDLAKASYDESKIAISEVRVDEILLDARELILKKNKNYKIDLQFVDDDLELLISGNEYLLRTAFANLMENNCKFSENKTSTVKIYSDDHNSISINFSDTGIGIAPDNLENIFKPFYRGNNKDYADGYGIGLTLVEKVVKILHGKIDLQSTVKEGTTFTISFLTKTEIN